MIDLEIIFTNFFLQYEFNGSCGIVWLVFIIWPTKVITVNSPLKCDHHWNRKKKLPKGGGLLEENYMQDPSITIISFEKSFSL